METVIMIAAIWISVLAICLWLNYRFHRSYVANSCEEFVFEVSRQQETMMLGARD